ncbi:MAG TPA: GNAT family N-acetyltransferase [Streptosporangiaceae bacterium]|nr:GNAT family N-acetyltransferase [Streptosporangiaceae bacterium]
MRSGLGVGIRDQVARRWQRIDPLLPDPPLTAPSCGAELITGRPDRRSAAGRCEHWAGAAESLDLSWGAARRFQLSALVAGPDVARGLDQLLSEWTAHLKEVPGSGDADTAALVNWPSRDVDGVAALLRHGLAPLEVIAARKTPSEPAPLGTPAQVDGLLIRRALAADIETVVRLGLEIIRFDSRFGTVGERPGTAAALRVEATARLLTGPDAWTWLAERGGDAVGMLAAQRPAAAGWIAPMVRSERTAYLELMFVEPSERGAGTGAALTETFHREVAADGVAVTLLHYEQLNPLSVPFWHRHGYRPLWTTWEATPARAIS